MTVFSTRNKNNILSVLSALILSFTAIFVLQGCGSSGGDALVDADPTGYYTGTAAVKDAGGGDLSIDDLQGMVNGTRFMVMSVANTLLYDGMITDVTVNDFTASVTVYKDGQVVSTTTMTGTITEGSQITGTITGTGVFNGTFTLVFAQSNSEVSAISIVENAANTLWLGNIGPTTAQTFKIDSIGNVIDNNTADDGVFASCVIKNGSTITPIANTRLYSVSMVFETCPAAGPVYTGLATTKGADDILVFTFADGILGASADYTLVTF